MTKGNSWCFVGMAGIALLSSGCVERAVLENDVRSAIWKSRTLSTQVDLGLAHAALSAELVELEALHQRDPVDQRVLELLARGYALMAQGFVEVRRLDALSAGDRARADQEASLRDDAESRARYYAKKGGLPAVSVQLETALSSAKQACERRDRSAYEVELNRLLGQRVTEPEKRLNAELARAIARRWLEPALSARCSFREP